MFSKILVPIDVDDPDFARSALARAKAMAEGQGARLRLVHVVELMPTMVADYIPPDLDTRAVEEAERRLSAMAAGLDMGERISTTVRIGGVYHEILEEAERFGADLIVVGSHRPAMRTYLIGSTATAIVRHAAISVLVVREATAED